MTIGKNTFMIVWHLNNAAVHLFILNRLKLKSNVLGHTSPKGKS